MPPIHRSMASLALLAALAACSHSYRTGGHYASRAYTPPGSPADPWGPYIREAATRFQVPETWVRAVMRQESGGNQYLEWAANNLLLRRDGADAGHARDL